ncbi:MAG: hypothetical protein ACPGQL_03950 [Thermoplasmatota archaeon]
MSEYARARNRSPSRLLVAAGLLVAVLALAAVGFVADTLTHQDASWAYLVLFVIACMGGAGALVITDPQLRARGPLVEPRERDR